MLVVQTPRKSTREGFSVNKSVSIPISFLNEVLDESEICNKDFSATLVMLARIGLSVRRAQDMAERERLAKGV